MENKALKYLEKVSYTEEDEFGESYELVSIQDAITACLLQELETLQQGQLDLQYVKERIALLNKQLKNL